MTNCLHYRRISFLQIRIVKLENCVSAQVFFCIFKTFKDEGVNGRGRDNVHSACGINIQDQYWRPNKQENVINTFYTK